MADGYRGSWRATFALVTDGDGRWLAVAGLEAGAGQQRRPRLPTL